VRMVVVLDQLLAFGKDSGIDIGIEANASDCVVRTDVGMNTTPPARKLQSVMALESK